MELPWLTTSLVALRLNSALKVLLVRFVVVPPDMYAIHNNTSYQEAILTMPLHSDSSILSYE